VSLRRRRRRSGRPLASSPDDDGSATRGFCTSLLWILVAPTSVEDVKSLAAELFIASPRILEAG
jgi:hypothetical protein